MEEAQVASLDKTVKLSDASQLSANTRSAEGQAETKKKPQKATDKRPVKERLHTLSNRFVGFEDTLHLTRAKKKEDEDRRIIVLQKQLTDLQAAITLESQNRNTSVRALQAWVEDQMEQWTSRVQLPLQQSLEKLTVRIEEVNDRIDVVEAKHEKERSEFPAIIDARSKELLGEIQDFRRVFEHDQKAQAEKHKRIAVRIQDQGARLHKQFVAEKVQAEKRVAVIRQDIQVETQLRNKADKLITQAVQDHVMTLQEQITAEIAEREVADDEIVAAVNHYTAALQDGLKIVSAT